MRIEAAKEGVVRIARSWIFPILLSVAGCSADTSPQPVDYGLFLVDGRSEVARTDFNENMRSAIDNPALLNVVQARTLEFWFHDPQIPATALRFGKARSDLDDVDEIVIRATPVPERPQLTKLTIDPSTPLQNGIYAFFVDNVMPLQKNPDVQWPFRVVRDVSQHALEADLDRINFDEYFAETDMKGKSVQLRFVAPSVEVGSRAREAITGECDKTALTPSVSWLSGDALLECEYRDVSPTREAVLERILDTAESIQGTGAYYSGWKVGWALSYEEMPPRMR